MTRIKQDFISVKVAGRLNTILSMSCTPTENRVMLVTPKMEAKVGNLIVPTTSDDNLPKKGVIVMLGEITEEYRTYKQLISTGDIVTYGMYAGKEIDIDCELFNKDSEEDKDILSHIDTDWKFTVLSLNEIILVERNFKTE